MSCGSSKKCSKSPQESEHWIQRVHQVQSKRTPEAFQAALQRVEVARQREVSLRKCKAVKGHAMRSHALVSEGLRQMAYSSERPCVIQERWKSAQDASNRHQMLALNRVEEAQDSDEDAPAALLVNGDEEEAEAMQEAAALVGATDLPSMAAGDGRGAAPASKQDLLEQLRCEPSNEEECAAKFMLYEGYASEVEQMRGNLFKFFSESRPTVPTAVAQQMDEEIKGIDTEQAMGIPDDAREWFVFHMMRTAERNNKKMAGILEAFEKKLEFLASNDQSECPVCLEPFQEEGEHVAETLRCCHKVCKDCWENWSAVMAGRPFCPLCRHEAFLGAVAARVTGAGGG